jgi:hypothetical protein
MENPELKIAQVEETEQVDVPVEAQQVEEEAKKVAAELEKDMQEVATAVEKAKVAA